MQDGRKQANNISKSSKAKTYALAISLGLAIATATVLTATTAEATAATTATTAFLGLGEAAHNQRLGGLLQRVRHNLGRQVQVRAQVLDTLIVSDDG